MKTKIMYECEICGCVYRSIDDAYNCECTCLGLSLEEYKKYQELLKEEKMAFSVASSANNEKIQKRCDDAAKAVIEFQKKYNLQEGLW